MRVIIGFLTLFVVALIPATKASAFRRSPLQLRQNREANKEGLATIQNDRHLWSLERRHVLVPMIKSPKIIYHGFPQKFRVCLKRVNHFLRATAAVYPFSEPFVVGSGTRTAVYEEDLARRNGNAMPSAGEYASLHLRGSTIDIAIPHSARERAWWCSYLSGLRKRDLIYFNKERLQPVFHIVVKGKFGAQSRKPVGRKTRTAKKRRGAK